MKKVGGSIFDISDQGIFYSVIDYGARKTKSESDNNAAIAAALAAMVTNGGGVLLIPHGITNTFNPATDFPVTANPLMVWQLTGNSFKIFSNQEIASVLGTQFASAYFDSPKTNKLRIVDALPATYTYELKVYNNTDTPLITGSSFDLGFFMPGGVVPVVAIARNGTDIGMLHALKGLTVLGKLGLNGQVRNSRQIVAPATGATVTIAATEQILILNHAATIAALTVVFPEAPKDGNTIEIFSRSIVTALTITSAKAIATGHTVTTIAAAGNLAFIYNDADSSWYRTR